MLSPASINALTQLLWTTPEDRVYALLDGASVPDLLDRLYANPRPAFECLFYGELAPDMAAVAPYLVALEQGSRFSDWAIAQGWGNHWGYFAVARVDLRALWFHLRLLNIIYAPDGKPMLFRYYDPRVLRIFLPTCSAAQVKEVFGPADRFVVEAENSKVALTYTHVNGEVQAGSRQIEST